MTLALCPLVARGLVFNYGRRPVLNGLSLTVNRGEIVALLGANGAGKSTLFAILAGLESPQIGELTLGGNLVATIGEDIRTHIAYVAHAPQVYLQLSARENLDFFAALRRTQGGQVRDSAVVLQRLGLTGAMDQPVRTYSRGMVQRVALARAFAQVAQLYLLDEPFTALDHEGVSALRELLREERKRGAGILLASHDPAVVADTADRVLSLIDGQIGAQLVRSEWSLAGFTQAVQAMAATVTTTSRASAT